MGEKNVWNSPGFLNRKWKQRIKQDRDRDITFSTSKEIPGENMEEKRQFIYDWLRRLGCFDKYENVNDIIKAMKIGPNKMKEQVLIECQRDGQSEEIYQKMMMIPARPQEDPRIGITHIDNWTWKRKDIPVYITWVRSSIDIQKYLIDGFLANYGQVTRHEPVLDKEGVETFEHVFIMKEDEIRSNPPPNFLWLGRDKLRVRYPGQVKTCWVCDDEGHYAGDCPYKKGNKGEVKKQNKLDEKEYPNLTQANTAEKAKRDGQQSGENGGLNQERKMFSQVMQELKESSENGAQMLLKRKKDNENEEVEEENAAKKTRTEKRGQKSRRTNVINIEIQEEGEGSILGNEEEKMEVTDNESEPPALPPEVPQLKNQDNFEAEATVEIGGGS